MYKNIQAITFAEEFQMGVMRVKQPLPSKSLVQLSPFLLLHHAGPMEIKPGAEGARISPHPHRGFEPVTFVYQGELFHRDSLGNEGYLHEGDVQWMTAGKGVVHSEGPSPSFTKKGGILELIQLWINLPKNEKMTDPVYQDISSEKIPVITKQDGAVKLSLVAGKYDGETGPARTRTPMIVFNGEIDADAETEIDVPEDFNTAIYLLNGEIKINDASIVDKLHFVIFGKEKNKIKISGIKESHFLFLSGEPINEPMVQYGPFVMNTNTELQQAILDYQNGEMGALDF